MSEYQFTVVIEPDEKGFHAFVPALPGCHSFGVSVEEAQTTILEAIEVHVESMIEDGEAVPVERAPVFITRRSNSIRRTARRSCASAAFRSRSSRIF